jgi:hypothetical protein
MSMHEFEDLVEDSIRILAKHSRHTPADRRAYFAQLCQIPGSRKGAGLREQAI